MIIAAGCIGAPKFQNIYGRKSHNQEFELYLWHGYHILYVFYVSMRATHRTGIDWIVSMYVKSQFMLRSI